MAVDPATAPIAPAAGWTFGQALEHMRSGGKVRQKNDPPGYFIHIVDGDFYNSRGEDETYLYSGFILATDWQPVAPEPTTDGGG